MAKAFGAGALRISVTPPDFDKYLENIEAAGNDIYPACEAAVNASLPIVEKTMKEHAVKHRRTGDVVNAIESTPAKREGNYIYGTVGIDLKKHPEAGHAVYEEYGDGHSQRFPDPFISKSVKECKAEVRSVQRAELKKAGVPIE